MNVVPALFPIVPHLEDALMREELALKNVADKLGAQQFGTPAYAATLHQNYSKLLAATAAAAIYRNMLSKPAQLAATVASLERQVLTRVGQGGSGLTDAYDQAELTAKAACVFHVKRLQSEVGVTR